MSEYALNRNHLTINGLRMVGFGSGDDAITMTIPDPILTQTVMADGATVASYQASRQATLVVKLRHNSPSNRPLRSLADNKAKFPFRWVEPDGTVHFAAVARISKVPDRSSGANPGEKTWEIMAEKVRTVEGIGEPDIA